MGPRPALPGRTRGGERIQASRPTRARLTAALAAVLAGSLVAGYLVFGAGPSSVMAAPAALGLLLLVAGLALPWPDGLAWAVLPLGSAYVLSLYIGGRALDVAAPLVGAGLLLMVELGSLSLELGRPMRMSGQVVARRVAALAALTAGCLLLGYVLLLLATAPLEGGVPLTAAGLTAAVAVLAMIAWLARRGDKLRQ